MNKIFRIITVVVLLLVAAAANAQNGLYSKYSNESGITKVYISKTMFDLLKESNFEIPEADDIDISHMISRLNYLYVLESEKPAVCARLTRDIDRFISDCKAELLMNMDSDGDNLSIYLIRDRDEKINDLLMKVIESDGEIVFIHLNGDIRQEDISKLVNK